jgi:hypothetical protein
LEYSIFLVFINKIIIEKTKNNYEIIFCFFNNRSSSQYHDPHHVLTTTRPCFNAIALWTGTTLHATPGLDPSLARQTSLQCTFCTLLADRLKLMFALRTTCSLWTPLSIAEKDMLLLVHATRANLKRRAPLSGAHVRHRHYEF